MNNAKRRKLLEHDKRMCIKHINDMYNSISSLSTLNDRMYVREVIQERRIRIAEIDNLLKSTFVSTYSIEYIK